MPPQPAPGYPQPPAYGAAGYPQPGYPAPPKPSTGVLPWAMGFLMFFPIPFLGALAAGVVMPAVRGTTSRGGDVARENGRSAANWGLTFLLVSTGLLALHFVVLFAVLGSGGARSFYPIGIPITLYAVVCLLHVVLTIIGTVRAGSGKIMRVPFAIPFFRS